MRSTITFARGLTLQFNSQVFLAKGHFADYRQLEGTSEFIKPDHYTREPDFNEQSLNANVVLRWEYLPGSTLYFVWSHVRNNKNKKYFTPFDIDFMDTFRVPASNVFLLKASYWFSL